MAQFETGAVGTVYFEPGGVFFRDGLIPLGMQQPATLGKAVGSYTWTTGTSRTRFKTTASCDDAAAIDLVDFRCNRPIWGERGWRAEGQQRLRQWGWRRQPKWQG
jgi:hypothetical protein